MPIDGDTFRNLMGQFATGCTVVTIPGDEPHGMTANAFSSVSLDPPMCLVCVDHGTTLYDRFDGGTDRFCVNILSEDQRDLAEHFAGMAELDEAPFDDRSTIDIDGEPLAFGDSLGYAVCEVLASHPAGDHDIVVGEVTEGELLETDDDPLLFFRGAWGRLG